MSHCLLLRLAHRLVHGSITGQQGVDWFRVEERNICYTISNCCWELCSMAHYSGCVIVILLLLFGVLGMNRLMKNWWLMCAMLMFQNWLAILMRHQKERECDMKLRGQRHFSHACFTSLCLGNNTSSAATTSTICISAFDQCSPCKLQLYILTAINTIQMSFNTLFFYCVSFVIQFIICFQFCLVCVALLSSGANHCFNLFEVQGVLWF